MPNSLLIRALDKRYVVRLPLGIRSLDKILFYIKDKAVKGSSKAADKSLLLGALKHFL